MENYQIDNLDRGILDALMENARTAYAELAKQFGVSPGTVTQISPTYGTVAVIPPDWSVTVVPLMWA